MRVLLPLTNTITSNLDNRESNSVNNEGDINGGSSNLIHGEIIVQQHLTVGLTVEVPLSASCSRQQVQLLESLSSENIREFTQTPEIAETINNSSEIGSTTNTLLLPSEQRSTCAVTLSQQSGNQSVSCGLSETQQQVLRRSRKRPSVSASTTSLPTYAAFRCLTTADEATPSLEYPVVAPIDRCTSPISHQFKRSRPDSKPAAKTFVDAKNSFTDNKVAAQGRINHFTMTGGGRRRFDSDDESVEANEPWVNNNRPGKRSHHRHTSVKLLLSPAENEPPSYEISPTREAVATHSPTDAEIRTFPENELSTNELSSFCRSIKKLGLEIVEQEGDGNCLFRAVSLQVYGHADHHAEVRERCMDFMASNEEHYSNFVAADNDERPGSESFEDYICRKRQLGVHGNHAEIQAVSELFNRPVKVYTANDMISSDMLEPINIFHTEYKTSDVPIRLSYHDGNHYNAIIDPLVPTAGLGLGLPGLQPGLADKLQVAAAVTESDRLADEIEFNRVLQESAMESKHWTAKDEDDDLQRALKESAYSVDLVSAQ